MKAQLSKPQKQSFREGYRLGLYTGGQMAKVGLFAKQPRECKAKKEETND